VILGFSTAVHMRMHYYFSTFFPSIDQVFLEIQRTLFNTSRHLHSFVFAFNEQVQNIEKSKAATAEVIPCFATVKARIQVKQSALTKLREGKDHDCALFMSDVSVLYKSCVAHLAKWTTLFAEF